MRILSFSFHWVLFFLFFAGPIAAQENESSFNWKVNAKKINEKQYQLVFQAQTVSPYFLYAPGQTLDEYPTASLELHDSSIAVEKIESGNTVVWANPLFENKNIRIHKVNATWLAIISVTSEMPPAINGSLFYTYGNDTALYPSVPFDFLVPLREGVTANDRIKIPSINIAQPLTACGDEEAQNKTLFAIFLLGCGGGLIALLTPCVFPMIPLTVSFFTKHKEDKRQGIRNAFLYAFFIFFIYVVLSLPFHFIDHMNPEVLNTIATNAWLNLAFFIIFVFFAFSFFGFYEITIPSGVINKINPKAGTSNKAGIFFMAFTLALVSFSCTGPILGSLLAGSISGGKGALQLSAGMAGFGLGLALPFALFSIFPQWLQRLPKSGGWLHTVKVVLGFVELAMALKFLSNADLVKQWGLLKRELFIGAWILICVGLMMYLLGVIRFPHDTLPKRISKGRTMVIMLLLLFTGYLAAGLTNTKLANLSWISGFPPPVCYSVYNNPVNCSDAVQPLKDYEMALMMARQQKKPLLVDFTGWACVNCRRMEENVWTDPEVRKLMQEEFVVVSLYVDERKKLSPADQLVYTTESGTTKLIKTVGDKWATFQAENFKAVSQPQYAILNTEEQLLTKTKSYTPDAGEFTQWLRCGLEAAAQVSQNQK